MEETRPEITGRPVVSLAYISALRADNAVLQARLRGTEILARRVGEREEECVLLRRFVDVLFDSVCRFENQLEALSSSLTMEDSTGEECLLRMHTAAARVEPNENTNLSSGESDSSRSSRLELELENERLRLCNLSLRRTHEERSNAHHTDSSRHSESEQAQRAARTRLALCEELSKKLGAYQEQVLKLEAERVPQLADTENAIAKLESRMEAMTVEKNELCELIERWRRYSDEQSQKASTLEAETHRLATEKAKLLFVHQEEKRAMGKHVEVLRSWLAKERQTSDYLRQEVKDAKQKTKTTRGGSGKPPASTATNGIHRDNHDERNSQMRKSRAATEVARSTARPTSSHTTVACASNGYDLSEFTARGVTLDKEPAGFWNPPERDVPDPQVYPTREMSATDPGTAQHFQPSCTSTAQATGGSAILTRQFIGCSAMANASPVPIHANASPVPIQVNASPVPIQVNASPVQFRCRKCLDYFPKDQYRDHIMQCLCEE